MQKKSLLFLFSLSLALLCMNLFVKPKSSPQKPQQAIEQTVPAKSIESRVATQAELPLVDVYKDKDGQKFLTSALDFDGNLISLAWEDEVPQDVYFRKSHSSFPLEKAVLSVSETSLDAPLLYKSENASKTLEAADLPTSGSFELLLMQPNAFDKKPNVYTAGYSKGNFSLHGQSVSKDALVVAKTESGYEPVGVYLSKEKKFSSFKYFFNLKSALSFHKLQPPQKAHPEQFYILENDYHQLVFSNYGGALAEINLPFKSDTNSKSSVYPVDIDKKIAGASTSHSFFPAHSYYTPGETSKGPFVEHSEKETGGYYPLLRRTVADTQFNPRYYAFNIVSDYPEISELPYKVTHFDKNKIVFEASQNHRKIIKTYTLDNKDSPYSLQLSLKVDGDARDLWITTGVPEAEFIANAQSPTLKYGQFKKNKGEVDKVSLPKTTTETKTIAPEWISNSNGFFTIILEPVDQIAPGYKANKVSALSSPTRILAPELATSKTAKLKDLPGYEFLLPLPDTSKELHFNVFAGPLDKAVLEKVDAAKSIKSPDYARAQTYQGMLSFITEPFSKLLFVVMNFFHSIVGSWGLSIILLTIFFRIILYPLNSWSIRAMKRTQELMPEVGAIERKYAKDPQRKAQETMALYRKRKANPMSGCLPTLIQFPFMIGMFNLLRSTFVLRGVPFIHGWIDNLTAPDVLFSWSTSLPIIGNQFHLLPIISGLLMWVQQRMMKGVKAKGVQTDKEKQQSMMNNMFMVLILFLFYSFPSGLNIYFISSTLLGILQQIITYRVLDKDKNKPTILDKKQRKLKEEKA